MNKHTKTVEFFLEDQNRSLFPLTTNAFMVQKNPEGLNKYIREVISNPEEDARENFLPQERVYADKSGHHLRRTAKLDPVAEFYLYDVVYRSRAAFKRRATEKRVSFGYSFVEGHVPPPSGSYREFSSAVRAAEGEFKYSLAFDVSSYFNSIYHHDLVRRFRDLVDDGDEVSLFGRFFREINAGRSVDCLPHGILPAKVLGSDFLTYVDESNRLRSALMLRFMDDFVLFSNCEAHLVSDFYVIQELLGSKGLSVNPAKTRWGHLLTDGDFEVDQIKVEILKKRRALVVASEGPEDEEAENLSQEETEYLLALLHEEEIEEIDAELALMVLREVSDEVLGHLQGILHRFPSLTKNAHHFIEHVEDKEAVGKLIFDLLNNGSASTQYQLFWLACATDQHLRGTKAYGDLLRALYEHPSASPVCRARILEIPEKKHGMSDLREEQLKSGGSGWLPWASAIGSRCEKAASRNHLLGYFANASPLNRLIAETVKRA